MSLRSWWGRITGSARPITRSAEDRRRSTAPLQPPPSKVSPSPVGPFASVPLTAEERRDRRHPDHWTGDEVRRRADAEDALATGLVVGALLSDSSPTAQDSNPIVDPAPDPPFEGFHGGESGGGGGGASWDSDSNAGGSDGGNDNSDSSSDTGGGDGGGSN